MILYNMISEFNPSGHYGEVRMLFNFSPLTRHFLCDSIAIFLTLNISSYISIIAMLARKYLPKSLGEVVGQDEAVSVLKNLVSKRDFPPLLFSGPPGCGKTSTAYALANELSLPVVELNASDERGIDTIREKIKTLSFLSGERLILLDECDSMTTTAQEALRRIIETAKPNVKFVLTANFIHKIIDPIKSRCLIINFKKLSNADMAKIIIKVMKGENKLPSPLTEEAKSFILTLVEISDGDVRRALNLLEALLTEEKALTKENLLLFIKPDISDEILKLVTDGKVEQAIKRLEDLYLEQKLDGRKTIDSLFSSIKKNNIFTLEEKLILYDRLAEVEHRILEGADPLLQLVSFLSNVYLVRFGGKELAN